MSNLIRAAGHDSVAFFLALQAQLGLDRQQAEAIARQLLLCHFARLCMVLTPPRFVADDLPPPEAAACRVGLFPALFFIFHNYSTPDQLSQVEARYKNMVLTPRANMKAIMANLQLDARLTRALSAWDKPRPLKDLEIYAGLTSRETLATVMLLTMADLVSVTPRPVQTTAEPKRSEPSPSGSKAAEPSGAASAKSATGQRTIQATAIVEPQRLTEEERKLKHEIETRLKLVETHNPLKIMSVSIDANSDSLRKIYMNLVNRFHPDRLGGTPLESMIPQCATILSAANDAYRILNTPDLRREFIQVLNDPLLQGDMRKSEQKKRVALEVEKAKVLFRKKDWAGLIPLAKRALGIFAEEPSLLAMVGWALYKEGGREEGEQYIDRSLKLDPRNEMAHFGKGEILRLAGQEPAALIHYEAVLRANPHNIEAQRLVALLKSR
ncbi:MAG: J domain-containing protein [Myxococcales bacterium]|nr:MAG: J domain-containing protein [Myxococcales bacterium]